MPYIEQLTICGDFVDVERFFVLRSGKRARRGANERPTSDEQQAINDRRAQKRLVQRINANFSREAHDVFATFTYRGQDSPEDEKTAKGDFHSLAGELRKWAKKSGLPEFKYIVTTEKQGQWHHHAIMNYVPLIVLDRLWNKGRVTVSTLEDAYDYKDLAAYMVKQDKKAGVKPGGEDKEPRRKFARRWSCSKNLKEPEVVKTEIQQLTINTPPEAPDGYTIIPGSYRVGADVFGNVWQSYSCRKIRAQKPRDNGKIGGAAKAKNQNRRR